MLVLSYAVVSGLVKRWYVAPALIFTLLGVLLGSFGLGLVDAAESAHTFTVLAQLALTVILFNQASAFDVRKLFRRGEHMLRLLGVGIPVSFALGTATALALLPTLPMWEAVCLAVIVAPTEVALIEALLEDSRIPERVRHIMSHESGFYDGFALAALFAAIAAASQQADPAPARWVWFAIRTELVSMVVGIVVGLAGALIVSRSRRSRWMSDTWAQLATLALAVVCFSAGELLHASGFVTAFAGGLSYALVSTRRGEPAPPTQVTDATAQLLEMLVFALLGATVVVPAWRDTGWRVVVFAVVALFAVRVVAVLIALLGTELQFADRVFVGWFGPRGIGTLVLGLLVIERGELTQQTVIGQAVVVTVTLSLVLHSFSTPPGIRLLARRAQVSATAPPALENGSRDPVP